MLIREPDGRWTFSRRRAFHVLRLDGTGALRPHRIKGVFRIDRGGVCINAFQSATRRRARRSAI